MNRLTGLVFCILSTACATTGIRPVSSLTTPSDALIVLPGFGYGRAGEQVLRTLRTSTALEGIDLHVPAYISRGGLTESRANLLQFLESAGLHRYQRVHVFAFLAGGWTVNPLIEANEIPRLATVIYDRSPLQERAPRIALEKLRLFTWLRFGSAVFDMARTPYPPLTAPDVKIALLIESRATSFVKRYARTARRYGPIQFHCDSFGQRYDDCAYVAMSHDELYARFAEVWPDVLSFIRTGRFRAAATRLPPEIDPLEAAR